VLCHVSGYFLLRFGFRMLRHFMAFALVASISVGLMVTIILGRSAKAELMNIAVFSVSAAVVLGAIGSVGAAIWWWLAVKPYNSSLNPGPSGGLA
ncbi:MAG TPA: hypothetical protein VJ654_08020, partial [Noviherbaspirillum sp.]|nr:hypothetical protein [Noviherbaspirillum sp.]